MNKLASYEIIEQINEGGMAVIYKAIHPDLKRHVIVKKLKEYSNESITRFKREAYVSAALNHENIIATFDFISGKSEYFLIMEYIEGLDLKTILSINSPLPPLIAAMISREIARALEHSHSRNFIHRDVKPSNVLISYNGEVKLIDFGVAKEKRDNNITQTGIIVGTPIYMSPEQVNGDEISNQSDIYALGVLFYEMVTGFKPYSANSSTELFSLISQGKYKSPNIFAHKIPFRVLHIIKKAMQKSLNKRYKTASEFIHDINKYLKWDNQVNIKYRLASFMSDVKLMSAQETKMELQAITESYQKYEGSNTFRSILAIILLMAFFAGIYSIYKGYCKRYLGDIKFVVNVPAATIMQNDEKEYKLTDGALLIKRIHSGFHCFKIEAGSDYNSFEGRYFIEPSKIREVNINLMKQPKTALLSISSVPQGAKVYLNGEYVGKSPVHYQKIAVGDYKIEMGLPGYEVWCETKKIQTNDNLQMFVELTQKASIDRVNLTNK